MARSSRQAGGLYTKGQTLISLSFRTTQSHGTLLLLGDFRGNSEYAVLEVSVRLLYSFSLIPKLDWNIWHTIVGLHNVIFLPLLTSLCILKLKQKL